MKKPSAASPKPKAKLGKEKNAAKQSRRVDIIDELTRTVAAVQGIEDAARGSGDLQGVDMSGVCTLLEMVADRLQQLATDLEAAA